MKCLNCNAEVFEGETHSQSCEYYLMEDTQEGILAFIKDAIGLPWKSIGSPYRLKTALSAVGLMLATLLTVGVTQIMSESGDSTTPWTRGRIYIHS